MKSRYKINLKYLLRENKITEDQLAKIIGVNKKDLFSSKIGLSNVEKISNLFMINTHDLVYGHVKKSIKILREMPAELKEDKQTMESIMQFFRIVNNYQKLNSLFLDSLNFESNPFNT